MIDDYIICIVGYLYIIIGYLPVNLQLTPAANFTPIIIWQMNPSLSNTLLLLALLLSFTTQSTDYSYSKAAYANTVRSSYLLPSSSAGNIISAIIDLSGAKNSYVVQLWPPASTCPFGSPEQSTVLVGTANYQSDPLKKSGVYQLEVLPINQNSPFPFRITIQINNVTVGAYADVARYDRMFVYYHQKWGQYSVSVSAPSSLGSSFTFSLFGPFNKPAVSGGQSVVAKTSTNNSITYMSQGNEYFYLVVRLHDDYLKSNKIISIKYQGDLYACPYGQGYSDYNSVYQGCSNQLPTIAYPCTEYSNQIQKCLTCAYPYIPNIFGVCIQSTSCLPNQYFQYGKCYDVISNCANFSLFGGQCYTCKDGYSLTTQSDGNQSCDEAKKSCGDNQYLLGNRCYDLVANCAEFQTSIATCFVCKNGYDLQNNSCVLKVTSPLNCPQGQYNSNGACVSIDENCIFFKPDNTCLLCSKGYLISSKGLCNKIICGARQYSGSGSCVDVSLFCATFDPIYGNCLTCIPLYYLQNDGSCLQGLPSQSHQWFSDDQGNMQNSNCPDRYYAYLGTCVQVSPSCKTYDLNSGKCKTCLNGSYYLIQSSGACVLASTYCTGYRQYFSKGECLQVSNLCDEYDLLTGNCFTCRDGSRLVENACLFTIECRDRQYQGQDGSCIEVSNLCDNYNAKNGECLSCIDGYELNQGGVCCYSKNYMIDANCIAFFATNCKRQRPRFNNCLECQRGYSLGNNIFGRCNLISDRTSD